MLIKLLNKMTGVPILFEKTELQDRVNIPDDTEAELAGKLGVSPGKTVFCFQGDNFATKLDEAVAKTGKDSDNRATLLVEPGSYTLSADYYLTEDYVDIISMSGQLGSIVLTGSYSFFMDDGDGNTASDNLIAGVDVTGTDSGYLPMLDNEPFVTFKKCISGDYDYWDDLTNACEMPGSEVGDYFCASGKNEADLVDLTTGHSFCDSGMNNGDIIRGNYGDDTMIYDAENNGRISDAVIGSNFFKDYSEGSSQGKNNEIIERCQIGSGAFNDAEQAGQVSYCDIDETETNLDAALVSGGIYQFCITSTGAITELEYTE